MVTILFQQIGSVQEGIIKIRAIHGNRYQSFFKNKHFLQNIKPKKLHL
jgi:hypothetical protein